MRPPIFRYLRRTIAHPSWAQRARDEVLAKVESDLTRYRALPLNAFERVQLLNSMLIPRWLFHTMLIPHDHMFQYIDKICLEFVAIAKGLEHNKENVGGGSQCYPHQLTCQVWRTRTTTHILGLLN